MIKTTKQRNLASRMVNSKATRIVNDLTNQHEDPQNEQDSQAYEDTENKVFGPTQKDIERSWESHGSERTNGSSGIVWKMMVGIVSLVILVSMLFGVLGPVFGGNSNDSQDSPELQSATVLRMIDGNTIVVDTEHGERTVQMIGVDTPIYGDPFYDFAQEVTQSWIHGEQIALEADVLDKDDQGRLLRYVYLDGVMINAAILLNGLGTAVNDGRNMRYNSYLSGMQRRAQDSGTGIWEDRELIETEGVPQASIRMASFTS